MRKRSSMRAGKAKVVVLKPDQPYWWLRPCMNKGRAVVESVSAQTMKNFRPVPRVYFHLHVREVSGVMPPSPSKVRRPGSPLPPHFRRPWVCVDGTEYTLEVVWLQGMYYNFLTLSTITYTCSSFIRVIVHTYMYMFPASDDGNE